MTDDASAAGAELQAALEALRRDGMGRVDPVRLRHMELIAQRLPQQTEAVRRVLEARLRRWLDDLPEAAPRSPLAAPPPLPSPSVSPLRELTLRLSADAAPGHAPVHAHAPRRPELKATQRFRETWARVAADRQVAQAFTRAPDNAGPLNSHLLVLRSLGVMRELSPGYLRRFMNHLDALQWLDLVTQKPLARPARAVRPRRTKPPSNEA